MSKKSDVPKEELLRVRITLGGVSDAKELQNVTLTCSPLDKGQAEKIIAPTVLRLRKDVEYTISYQAENEGLVLEAVNDDNVLLGVGFFTTSFGEDTRVTLRPRKRKLHDVNFVLNKKHHDGIIVYSSVPDINGKTYTSVPGRLTFPEGIDVTFSTVDKVVDYLKDPLYDQVVQTADFAGWVVTGPRGQDDPVRFGHTDNTIQVKVDGSRRVELTFLAAPRPFIPNVKQLHIMMEHLSKLIPVMEQDTSFLLLHEGQPLRMGETILFTSRERALQTAAAYVRRFYPDWKTKLPDELKNWMTDNDKFNRFVQYWLKQKIQVVSVNELAKLHEIEENRKTAREKQNAK